MNRIPPFGALVTNLLAEHDSPYRRGYFVAVIRHQGRGPLQRGTYWRLTDGAGEFWEIHPTAGEAALHPQRRRRVVEVDESTALPVIERVRHG